jgi:hypothetical protein
LSKTIQFLVGARGKDVMGIGGPWSPEQDGADPDDPQTLIKTAVRTTHSLTGIDLSDCPRWYKMVHLRYYRAERDRIDSVVLMMPDLTVGLMPTVEEYDNLKQRIQKQLADKLAAIDAEVFVPPPSSTTAEVGETLPNGSTAIAEDSATTEDAAAATVPATEEAAPTAAAPSTTEV